MPPKKTKTVSSSNGKTQQPAAKKPRVETDDGEGDKMDTNEAQAQSAAQNDKVPESTSEEAVEEPKRKQPKVASKAPVDEAKKSRGRPAVKKDGATTVNKSKLLPITDIEGDTKCVAAGDGETGQLGIGTDGEDGKPRFVAINDIDGKIISTAAGGMHSLILTSKGKVFSFGCNDDGSLGRSTKDEEDCFIPALTPIDAEIVKITVGNIHSAALTTDCRVFVWGSYRDSNGPFGIVPENMNPLRVATELKLPERIIDIASGSEHTIFLSDKGHIFTMGCAEQGRLGRIRSSQTTRDSRRARETMLKPLPMPVKRGIKFDAIWAGRYNTFARTTTGQIYGCGLNNFAQLGEVPEKSHENNFVYSPVELKSFSRDIKWTCISSGEQHTLALDVNGNVYSMGRALYGRLGLGNAKADDPDVKILTKIKQLENKCVAIATGEHNSFAVTKDGTLFSWGQGLPMLGQGNRENADEQDVFIPTPCTSKVLKETKVVNVSAGGNHALCVVKL